MPNLKVIYIAGYNVAKNSGRSKATREKAAALADLPGITSFQFMYPGNSRYRVLAYLKVLLFDLVTLGRLFFVDKNIRIIQRTTFLPFTNLYLKLRGVKIIYELHTDLREEIKYYHVGPLEKSVLRFYVFAEKFNLALADAIIYNHPVLQRIMQPRYPVPSIFTYNGANVKDFYPMDMPVCRTTLALAENCRYYLFIGSLAHWRGVEWLITIFNDYMDAFHQLLIIGNVRHSYGEKLRKSSGPNIRFIDELPVDQLVVWINAADLCLVPVRPILSSPGNPLKLYDYLACGKPVVGQENVTGCSDEILRYNAGMVTDFSDPARASAELREFGGNYTARNRHTAIALVSWQCRMRQWTDFLEASFADS